MYNTYTKDTKIIITTFDIILSYIRGTQIIIKFFFRLIELGMII